MSRGRYFVTEILYVQREILRDRDSVCVLSEILRDRDSVCPE